MQRAVTKVYEGVDNSGDSEGPLLCIAEMRLQHAALPFRLDKEETSENFRFCIALKLDYDILSALDHWRRSEPTRPEQHYHIRFHSAVMNTHAPTPYVLF